MKNFKIAAVLITGMLGGALTTFALVEMWAVGGGLVGIGVAIYIGRGVSGYINDMKDL